MHTLLTDVKGWKNPGEHASHVGCKVTDPAAKVYFPGGHLVWAVHQSVLVLLVDVKDL